MSPVDGIERISHELFEPGLVEEVYRLLVLIPFHVYDFERACHDKPSALLHASGEVKIYFRVPVDVVQALAAGAVHIDGRLPGIAPVLDVLPGECIGGALQVDDHFLHPLDVFPLGQIKIAVWRLQYVFRFIGKHTAEKVFNIHNPTSYDEAASDSCKQMNFRTEAHLLRQPKANQGQFFRPVRLQAT